MDSQVWRAIDIGREVCVFASFVSSPKAKFHIDEESRIQEAKIIGRGHGLWGVSRLC